VRIIELEIKNWKKHNPRADVKTCTWFKMSNDFFNDPDFYMISGDGQRLWFYILGQASKKVSSIVKINTQMAANALRIDLAALDYALLELVKTGSLSQKPITLVSDDLPSERKEEITWSTEERRGEEKRLEERENVSLASEKNLSEKQTQDFRNSKDIISTGLKNPDELIILWNSTLAPKGFPYAPLQFSSSGADKFFQMNKLLHQNGKSWAEYITRITNSEFLTRRKRGGPPSVTWLFIESNFDDVMSGKYDNDDNGDDEDIYAKIKDQA
jgi:hypothetical protein